MDLASSVAGMFEVDEKIMFKVKWRNSTLTSFVDAKEAKTKCPQIVIQFYEKCIQWIQ